SRENMLAAIRQNEHEHPREGRELLSQTLISKIESGIAALKYGLTYQIDIYESDLINDDTMRPLFAWFLALEKDKQDSYAGKPGLQVKLPRIRADCLSVKKEILDRLHQNARRLPGIAPYGQIAGNRRDSSLFMF